MPLELTVRKPGTLLSRLMKTEITDTQFAAIVAMLSSPDDWVLVRRDQLPKRVQMGFRPNQREEE